MMNLFLQIIARVYARALRLYPRGFQEQFSSEMQTAFDDLIHDTAKTGLIPLLVACFRETTCLPVSVLREFWHEFNGKEKNMQAAPVLSTQQDLGSGRDAFLSGLPHLLVAAFIGVNKIYQNGFTQPALTILPGVLWLIALVIMFVYAWRQKWPLWSASWYGYWLWLGLVLPALGLSWLNAQLEIFVDWQFDNFVAIVVLILPVIGLFWLFKKNRRKGLLAVLFLMPVLLPLVTLEFVPDTIEAFLSFGSGIIAALSATLIMRWENRGAQIGVVLGSNLLMGMAYSYVQVYQVEVPFPGQHAANPADLVINLMIFITVSMLLTFVPLLFWALWDVGKRRAQG